jgi:hypothetical protein
VLDVVVRHISRDLGLGEDVAAAITDRTSRQIPGRDAGKSPPSFYATLSRKTTGRPSSISEAEHEQLCTRTRKWTTVTTENPS